MAARTLAERFGGDKGAADWRHFGRLAGVTNREGKYQGVDGHFPFVRLIETAPGKVYANAEAFLRQIQPQPMSKSAVVPPPRPAPGRLLAIDDFRERPQYGGDGNRNDLAYAVNAIAHGVSGADVRAAIMIDRKTWRKKVPTSAKPTTLLELFAKH